MWNLCYYVINVLVPNPGMLSLIFTIYTITRIFRRGLTNNSTDLFYRSYNYCVWTTYRWRGAGSAKSNNDILVSTRPTGRLTNSLLTVRERIAGRKRLARCYRRSAFFPARNVQISRGKLRLRRRGLSFDRSLVEYARGDLRPAFRAIDRKNHRWRLARDRRGSSCPRCSLGERKVSVGIIRNAGGTTSGSCPSMPISAHLVGYRGSMATGEQWHVWRVDNCE